MNSVEKRGIEFLNQVFEGRIRKVAKSTKGDLDIGHISQFKGVETLKRFIFLAEKAINGQYDEAEDWDISSNIDIAFITKDCVEYYDQDGQEIVGTCELQDFKELAEAWLQFLLTKPLEGSLKF